MTTRLALDTNAYRFLNEGNHELARLSDEAAQIGLPIIVLGEIYNGIYLGNRQADNLVRLSNFLATPRIEVLQIDEVTAKMFGEIATDLRRTGRPIRQNDMWIAALCKQYNFVLATRDADFARVIGLELARF